MNTSPCRILFFLPDLDGGGSQRTLVNLAGALPRDRFSATLAVGRSDGPARDWLAGHVPLVDLNAPRLRWTLGPLRGRVKRERPHILFSSMPDANVAASLAVAGLRSRPGLILRETNSHRHRGDLGWLRRKLIGWAYARADAVVALSEGVREELVEDCALDPERTVTIHNPVDVGGIAAATQAVKDSIQEVPLNGPLIVGCGRLHRQKGFDLLIEAFADLDDARTRLVILGEGPEREALEALARSRGVADRVLMPGFESHPEKWLAQATLFVLPSRWEGFGHVLVEALAAGVPVVSAWAPHGPADILDDGETGLMVPTGNAAALGAAIDRLLIDKGLRGRLAEAGRKTAERFSLPVIAGRYSDLIENVAAKNPVEESS
ncbi:MAG: glycosyltransferase [Alphaproteobacteria bacterium]|nr:glycosyltransferase [Alphaproteobacteria bacterium]